jgi:hypothetical protein
MKARPLVLAVVGILVVAGGSLAVILMMGDSSGTSSDLAAPAAEGSTSGQPLAPLSPLPGAPGADGSPAPAQGWVAPPAPQQGLLEAPDKDSWDAVPIAAKAVSMGPVGVAISRALQEVQPEVSACFDEAVQSRFGQQKIAVMNYAPNDEAGSTVLVLEMETLHDEVQIVDALAETRGSASDGLIACAQSALRGHRLATPGARPGQRLRLRYTVTQ